MDLLDLLQVCKIKFRLLFKKKNLSIVIILIKKRYKIARSQTVLLL